MGCIQYVAPGMYTLRFSYKYVLTYIVMIDNVIEIVVFPFFCIMLQVYGLY